MNRKDYVAVSKILAKHLPTGFHETELWLAIRDDLMTLFEEDNDRFNPDLFKKACYGSNGVKSPKFDHDHA